MAKNDILIPMSPGGDKTITVRVEQSRKETVGLSINQTNIDNYVGMKTYNSLTNKPKINGVELVGDLSTADLKIDIDTSKYATKEDLKNIDTVVYHDESLKGTGSKDDPLTVDIDLSGKQDKLTAGANITISDDNVISSTMPIATETQAGINRTYTAGANIRIEDNVISSTAQESFFRGRFAEWTSVPTSSADYTADFHGNTTPSYNDYIVVEDASLYIPQDFLSDPNNVMIRNLHSAGVGYTIEVVIQDQIRRVYYQECTNGEYAQINDWLSVTYVGGAPGIWYIKTNKEFYINNVFTPTANKLELLRTNTPYETNFYLSEKPGVAPVPIYGSWRFVYHGVWADDNILGWKPEYQVEETLPMATDTQAGIAKLYTTSGSNADGAMTQRAVGNAISAHNTATNAHSNIRGVAGGLATLDNNAKVPMAQINDALIGNVSYQGLWDAATNTPFLADPTGGLPAGYKALGYIDFRTETFIDTGVFIDETDETVEYDIKMTPSNTGCFPFGAAGSNAGDNNTGTVYFYGSTLEYFAGDTRNIRLGEVVKDKDYLINIKIDQTTQTITVVENDLRTSQNYTGSIISPVSIILGGLRFGSASSPQRSFGYNGKIHYFIIRKNGVTVKQYQPAQRISDGAYGFYEQVSGEFVVSSGSSFASGGGEIEIPKGYYYITTVAGDRFGLHFDVGDWIISSGGYWSKVDNTDAVSAVNGMTGNVVLNANDVNAYNKTEIDDKFAEVNAQINTNTEAIADAKDDINDLQTQINTRTRVIIRRWE